MNIVQSETSLMMRLVQDSRDIIVLASGDLSEETSSCRYRQTAAIYDHLIELNMQIRFRIYKVSKYDGIHR